MKAATINDLGTNEPIKSEAKQTAHRVYGVSWAS